MAPILCIILVGCDVKVAQGVLLMNVHMLVILCTLSCVLGNFPLQFQHPTSVQI